MFGLLFDGECGVVAMGVVLMGGVCGVMVAVVMDVVMGEFGCEVSLLL